MTTHIDIRQISKALNKNIIIDKVRTINNWYKMHYKTPY